VSTSATPGLVWLLGSLSCGTRTCRDDGSEKPSALNLVEHFVSPKGVVITTYEPAGEVPTGSFASKAPSEEELERRRKIAAGTW